MHVIQECIQSAESNRLLFYILPLNQPASGFDSKINHAIGQHIALHREEISQQYSDIPKIHSFSGKSVNKQIFHILMELLILTIDNLESFLEKFVKNGKYKICSCKSVCRPHQSKHITQLSTVLNLSI